MPSPPLPVGGLCGRERGPGGEGLLHHLGLAAPDGPLEQRAELRIRLAAEPILLLTQFVLLLAQLVLLPAELVLLPAKILLLLLELPLLGFEVGGGLAVPVILLVAGAQGGLLGPDPGLAAAELGLPAPQLRLLRAKLRLLLAQLRLLLEESFGFPHDRGVADHVRLAV